MPREPSHGFSSIGEIFLLTFPFIELLRRAAPPRADEVTCQLSTADGPSRSSLSMRICCRLDSSRWENEIPPRGLGCRRSGDSHRVDRFGARLVRDTPRTYTGLATRSPDQNAAVN